MAALLLLGACSRTGFVYANADWLIYRSVVRLVDADQTQRAAWREAFRQLHVDHRNQLAPRLAAWLGSLHAAIEEGRLDRSIDCLAADAERLYRAHVDLLLPLASRILAELSNAQLAHLAEAMEERNRDYAAAYLAADPLERERDRVLRYAGRIEAWTGALSAEQMELLEAGLGEMPDSAATWLEYRRIQQGRLLALLHAGADNATLRDFLDAWWSGLDGDSAALRQQTAQMRRHGLVLMLALSEQLSAGQRQRLMDRVADLQRAVGGASVDHRSLGESGGQDGTLAGC